MKQTREPGKWLIGEKPIREIKDAEGFIKNMYGKTIVLGIISIVYGIVGVVDDLIQEVGVVKDGLLLVFLAIFLIFCVMLQKAKAKYL
jgi:hypothetical protein